MKLITIFYTLILYKFLFSFLLITLGLSKESLENLHHFVCPLCEYQLENRKKVQFIIIALIFCYLITILYF